MGIFLFLQDVMMIEKIKKGGIVIAIKIWVILAVANFLDN